MNTLTNKDKLALQVSLALVAGMFSLVPVAQGAPVLDKVVSGGATVSQSTTNVTTVQSSNTNNIINWKDFSVGNGEKVVFDASDAAGSKYTKTNNYLNIVTGNGTSYINGAVQGGNNVYLVNPNGVIMGKDADIDVGNLYVSTKNLTNVDTLAANGTTLEGASILEGTVNEEIVNMGKIRANSVYAEGTNIRFVNTAKVTSDGSTPLGNVTLNASGYVHIGYEATAERNTEASDTNGQYAASNIDTSKTATSLGYSVTYSDDNIDYALVRNPVELQNMNSNKSLNYMLYNETGKITLSGTFTPIGDGSDPFTGNFDGNFHTINDLTNTEASNDYTGLFGYVKGASSTKRSNIMNVGVVDVKLRGKAGKYVGGIAGYIENANLENVYNKATKTSSYITGARAGTFDHNNAKWDYYNHISGGIVGYAKNSNIENVYNNSEVINGAGLVGKLDNSTLKNAYNAGLVYVDRDYVQNSESLDKHYAIVDAMENGSNVENVYGSGSYQEQNISKVTTTSTTVELASSATDFTNAYQIDSSSKKIIKVIGDTSSANYHNNNNSYELNGSGNSADNFGFFESTADSSGKYIASTKSSDGVWRIYEGHTLPLLRSFLKANGNGTVPVSYTYNLYATEDATSPTKQLTGSNADGTVTYNGYYIGIANITTDTVRGLDSNKMKPEDSVKAKNVGSTLSAFYSTGQDGYDLAGDTLHIVARNLAPSSSRTDIDKVYDGSADAKASLGSNLFEKIDLRNYAKDPGYGIVQVYDANGKLLSTQDDVSLAEGFITSATYDNGPNVTNDSNITFTVNSNVTALTGTDADKYILTAADIQNIHFSGDITKRPVIVSLNQSTGINKIYDGTSQIVDAKGPDDTSVTHTYKTGNVKVEDYNATNNSGLVDDDVEFKVADAYYSTDGTIANKVSNANTTPDAYKAAYALLLKGTKASNYELQDTAGNALDNNILMGTGTIAKRNVTLDNIAFLDSAGNEVDNTKVYDFSSAYTDATQVSFTSGAVATEAEATSQNKIEGVLAKDQSAFSFTLGTGENAPKFYNGDGESAAEIKTAGEHYIKYVLTAPSASSAAALSNYTLNGQEVNGGNVSVFRQGRIEKRAINIGMLTDTGIDKTYDTSAEVEDRNSVGYEAFKGTAASGTVTTAGYVGYGNTAYKLTADDLGQSLNDGTSFSISAVYTNEAAAGTGATTTNAADVYVNDSGAPAAKKIKYTVSLTGDYADNYTLNGEEDNSVELIASGTINPRKITGITFADVSKKYDGTATVGEVNNITQTNNTINIIGVTIDTSDGVTANATTGLLGDDQYADVLDTTNSNIAAQYGTHGWTTDSGTDFVANEHAYDTDGDGIGKTRLVQYTGVRSLTSNNHNYTLAGIDDTQYGNGRIDPLTIDTITTSGNGEIKKIYDGTTDVVGGWNIQYQIDTSHNTGGESDIVGHSYLHQTTADDLKNALGTIAAKGDGVGGGRVSLNLGTGAYGLNTDATAYDNKNVGSVSKIVYAVDIAGTNGDYVLADSGTGYTKEGNLAKIDKANSGLISARVLNTKGVIGLSKEYDGTAAVKDANGNVLKGDDVVTFEAKTNYSGLTDNDGVTNVSTAEYYGDTRNGYNAQDANIYTDGQTSAENAKIIKYTVKLSDDAAYGNYVIYKDTNYDGLYAPADSTHSYTVTAEGKGGNITQKDLTVSFGNIEKTYDTNAYVMDHTEGDTTTNVTLSSGNTDAVLAGTVAGDTISLVTQDTSTFWDGSNATADAGPHQVKYDLVSTSANLKNYRLVDIDGTALEFEKNGDTYTVTAYGNGKINPREISNITALIDNVSKVYDGTNSLTYAHTAADGYEASQQETVNSITSVRNITLGTLTITSGFSVDEDNTAYTDANAGTGNKTIIYTLKIDGDVLGNYKLSDALVNSGTVGNDGSFTFTQEQNTNTITAKNVYASLTGTANPTKEYDGSTTVIGKAKDGNDTITQDMANSYVSIAGMVDADPNYTVTPTYADKNVAVDGDGKVLENLDGSKTVNYLVSGLSNNYNLSTHDANGIVNGDNSVKLVGTGTITPKEISLNATKADKVYDAKDTVKLTGGTADPQLSIDTGVTGENITVATGGDEAIKGSYGNYAGDVFTADGNVALDSNGAATYKAVQYTNLANALTAGSDTLLTNYQLVSGNGGIYSADNNGTVTFAAEQEKGKITKLAINSINADISTVEKVYDGTGSLTYVHNAANGYDESQTKTVDTIDSVNGITLGDSGVKLTDGNGYTIDAAGYTDANVGTGNKNVKYTFTVDKSVFNNLELSTNIGGGSWSNGNYTFDLTKTGNTITAKNVYATLTDLATTAAPTKVYNGQRDVVNNRQTDLAGTAKDVSGYMTVAGLVNNDTVHDTATISAEYVGKDVLGEGGSTVSYTADITNPNNYNLYVDDGTNKTLGDTLTGQGTITPKRVTLDITKVEKVYNGTENTAIDVDVANPSITTGVGSETIVLNNNYISGKYGNYTADGFVANGDVNYGTSYVDKAGYKAVQYTGLKDALKNHTGSAVASNYELVGTYNGNDLANSSGYIYDATNDTVTFSEKGEKGRITRLAITNLKTKWKSVDKEYDATPDIEETDRGNAFMIYTDALGTAPDKWVDVNYDLKSATYTDANGTPQSNVGDNYNMHYVLEGITGTDLHNFSMDALEDAFKNKEFDSKNGNATYNLDGTVTDLGSAVNGEIKQRTISGVVQKEQVRTYNGDIDANAGETYFKIDGDDLDILDKDLNGNGKTVLKVDAKYANKNSSLTIDGNSTGNANHVNYTIGWKDTLPDNFSKDNYKFADTYEGAGDIVQRRVYVVDGGNVQKKTYDGTDTVGTVDTSGKFTLAPLSGNTGVIVADEEKVTLAANITNVSYDGSDVERDNTGKVVNKGIIYTGTLALSGDAADVANYYMDTSMDKAVLSDSNGNSVVSNVSYLNTGGNNYTITEDKGGRINPIKITIGLTNSPTKTYDTKTSVTGNYNDDVPYASVSNLKAASDKASTTTDFQSVNDSTLELTLNPRTDVNETVKVTMSGGNYSNKNAGSDKVTSYTLTWDNPNYELVGETTTTNAGQDKDTFDVTSYDSADPAKKGVSGILKDYRGTITPFDLSIASMDSSKTYDGSAGVTAPDVTVTFSDASKNMLVSDGANINNMLAFLGFKVTGGTYGGPTDEALAAAEADGNISDGDIATTTASDASFNEKSAPFVHKVLYDGISITNGNYRIGDSSFAGTGTINRAPITAKANDALVKVGEAMPKFSGTMFGFVSKTDADRYNGLATWGPEAGVSTGEAGTNPVYGWYRNLKSGVNLGKNYVLEYQQPGTFTVEAEMAGDMIGYLDKPVVPDNKVYQNVSKDENKSHTHEPKAAIQYGNTGTGIVADRDEGGSSGTIAIELAEVVNLLGGEVASDGTMSLANQERKSSLSVGSTSEGFLSVGNGDNEASGQTDLFSEGEIAIENKDGEIGLENEENLWQGQAELAMAEGSILSDGQIVNEEDEKDKDKKKKTLEEKTVHEASATITYGDVA